jgi:hypothetical protein
MMIRRLASAVLTAAVRHASPGVREWGTAMLREMDFVESDWAALLWAIGSVPVLFKHSEAPMSDPSAVFLRAQALTKEIGRRTLMGYGACVIVTVYFASFIFVPNTLQRIGSCLAVPATLYLAYPLYARICAAARQLAVGKWFVSVHRLLSSRTGATARLSPWHLVVVALGNHVSKLHAVLPWFRNGASGGRTRVCRCYCCLPHRFRNCGRTAESAIVP